MIEFKGKLKNETRVKIKNNETLLNRLLGGSGLNRPASKITTVSETVAKYNPGITRPEIEAWVWYRRKNGIPMKLWKDYFIEMTTKKQADFVKNGVLFVNPENLELEPFPIFVFGNVYTKLTAINKADTASKIIDLYGSSVFDAHIKVLNENKPAALSIQNPMESERPIILAISEFAKEFGIRQLREDSGLTLDLEESLFYVYKKWLQEQDRDILGKVSAYEISTYYLGGANKPRDIDKIEWGAIKKLTKETGERLFKVFLHEALEHEDQLRLDAEYNVKYNAIPPLQYQKIPIGIEVSRKFMGFDLDIRPAQREGIAFMELVGSGIIAYDVGVGKTITAIIEVASALKNGKCKRPLIVVPNPTYNNWIKEMFGSGPLQGILSGTGIKLNEWYNLGVGFDGMDLESPVDEGSITLVTYEGLNKIGFSAETQKKHLESLSTILGQSGGTERNKEKELEKFRSIIGVGIKDTVADVDTLGFDYVVVDEAHNYKNVFTSVKSDGDNKKQFEIQGGQPSNRAVKLFFLTNYIQREYGRNVMLLTATPFTNSPLEIYSMLSFVAHEYMVKNNIRNITRFFELYIQETYEYVVAVDGSIQQKSVVKSFNNRISLQKLIASHINFKTGEEVNIPRPCKVNLPITKTSEYSKKTGLILTYLKLNEGQSNVQKKINAAAATGQDKNDPGKLLRLMSRSLNNALTPFLSTDNEPFDYKDFVENSPKIQYTMDCVKSVKQWHEKRNQPVSGQVIYIDRGKDYFRFIKEYLEKELGYKTGISLKSNPRKKIDEVEIMIGGMPAHKKEAVKEAFNDGICKIIIGTSTIKEGINLQKKSTVLYNLYPNWNPTDLRQLEGRILRQKNEFGFVRVVMPLMENSMDVFVFQKLEEKTARINDLWNRNGRGNVLDEDSLDPNEVKYALVTDINKLVEFEKDQIGADLKSKEFVLRSQLENLDGYSTLKSNQNIYLDKTISFFKDLYQNFGNTKINDYYETSLGGYKLYSDIPDIDLKKIDKKYQNKIKKLNELYKLLTSLDAGQQDIKTIVSIYRLYKLSLIKTNYVTDLLISTASKFAKLQKSLFTNRGYDENTNIDLIKVEIEKEITEVDAEIKDLKSPEFKNKLFDKITKEKKRLQISGGTIQDRVNDFKKLNNLLSYRFSDVDHSNCVIPLKENKSPIISIDKTRKLKLAKAKVAAIRIKLALVA